MYIKENSGYDGQDLLLLDRPEQEVLCILGNFPLDWTQRRGTA
ncbi:hypothetical protein HMPREF0322_04450 [Desulfitobacterium hafniense DP7]|uniref:Uncharacterized protein n=1 Tax=Desulfitobacterium hafniense DP7 TaxID=537010 RepID=G9XTZ2_DESHA|nr:hypothetical protein HMPREF0322_04450 [Desulfitobacterium hafniense DP7]